MPNIFAFLSYVFITTFTPGPNNIMSMVNASQYGFKKSIKFNIGVLVGFLVVMTFCIFFTASLYKMIPAIKPYLQIIGAAYILHLAYKTYKSSYAESEGNQSNISFASGAILQFINVKVILYGITTASTFIVPYYHSNFKFLLFSIFLAFIGFIGTCCWSLFGITFKRFFKNYNKAVNIVMSLLLVYCAVSLFV